ncbi:MAG: MFS transporter [Pseudomonadota bacterium]
MLRVLRHKTYRHLFTAQVMSLIGTGLTTVALALLAYDLAPDNAGAVLGTALALKMVAYVVIAPLAGAFAHRFARRTFLVALDLVRAGLVVFLPFVTEVWQIYVLVFLFQSFSAAFTPTFQATIPDILPDEDDYTAALSLSRLAYDLEMLLSPLLAGALLTVISFHALFFGTTLGFLLSAAFVVTVALPPAAIADSAASVRSRLTRGIRIYLATPRLRGLLAFSAALAAGTAMVIVNTVVYVREVQGGSDRDVALFLAVFGLGSMLAAIVLPRLLHRISARTAMTLGGALTGIAALAAAAIPPMWASLALWGMLGVGASLIQTPGGLLLRRSAHPEDRPAVFSAQFALSHACWLVAYPLAGWGGAALGLSTLFILTAIIVVAGIVLALSAWPAHDPEVLEHEHGAFEHAHGTPHDALHGEIATVSADGRAHRHRAVRHAHAFVIDDHHPVWPTSAGGR